MPTLAFAIAVLLWPGASIATAAPGDLDPSFSGDGFAFERVSPRQPETVDTAIAVQPDGKLLVGLILTPPCHICTRYYTDYLVRLNADGSLDPTFGSDGFVQLRPTYSGYTFSAEPSMDIAVQDDGAIVLGLSGGPEGGLYVARLLADGRPDPSFGGGDGTFAESPGGSGLLSAKAIGLTDDQRIVVIGSYVEEGLGSRLAVARLRTDGTLDPSFSEDGWLVESIEATIEAATTIGAAGEILVLADPIDGEGELAFRYRSDGGRDPGFGQDGVSRIDTDLRYIGDVEVDSLGRATFTGFGSRNHGGSFIGRIDRFGALDTAFGDGGTARLEPRKSIVTRKSLSFRELALDGAGRSLVAAQDRGVILGRLTESGQMDASFSGDGWSENHVRRGLFFDGPVGDVTVAGDEIFVGGGRWVKPPGEDRVRGGVAVLNYLAAAGSDAPDSDADGKPDSRDRCPMLFVDCPRFGVRVRAWYRRSANTIRGFASSAEASCIERRVFVFRRQRGPDRRIGSGIPSGFSFRVALGDRVRGDVYAVTRKRRFGYGVCPRARSSLVTIK